MENNQSKFIQELSSSTSILLTIIIIGAFLLGVTTTKMMQSPINNGAGQQAAPSAPTKPSPAAKVDISAGHFPILGNKNAKVTVIEFADFRCPFCERFFTDVTQNLKKNYIDTGKIKFAFRSFAFLGPASTLASNAAECANEQGKFWEMHDYFYKNQPPESDISMYTVDNLTKIAGGTLGMNTAQFNSCLSANKYNKNVSSDLADGQKAGVGGTPSTFVNGKIIVGACPFTTLDGAIKAELAGKPWTVTNCQIQ